MTTALDFNPAGFWFFHCHVSNHIHLGMGMVLQVGDEHEMPPVPRDFPRCGASTFGGDQDQGAAGGSGPSLTLVILVILLSLFIVQPSVLVQQ